MSDESRDDFYVGYLERAPGALASWVRGRVLLVGILALAVAPLLTLAQNPFSRATFEFGTARTVTGLLQLEPYPTLLVPRPGDVPADGLASRYLLVAFGKFGARELAEPHDGQWVTAVGTLVHRRDHTMIELTGILPAAAAEVPAGALETGPEDLGEHTYVGEIVDSKCFLGVMKPGSTKPHRACATRCISGGIPPVLLVRDDEGRAAYFLLTSAEGEAVGDQILELIAEPLRIHGRVFRYGDRLVLRADPETYERL